MPKRKIKQNVDNLPDEKKKQYCFGSGNNCSTVTVWCEGRDYDPYTEGYRPIYSYQIDTTQWSYTSNDIRGSVNEIPNLFAASQSLFAFLYVCAVSSEEGEDRDMFPEHVRLWAEDYLKEIQVLSLKAAESASVPQPESLQPKNPPETDELEELFGSDDI
jgi:hypothetical protein